MHRTLFGHHISHHQVATIPIRTGTAPSFDCRDHEMRSAAAPVIVGVCGTDRSRWAVEYAARTIGADAPVYLVSAVCAARRDGYERSGRGSAEERRLRDALGADGYLLTDLATIYEVQRHAEEIARAAGALDVHGVVRSGGPAAVLTREARALGASAVVLGCETTPTQLARKICATDGFRVLTVPRGVDACLFLTASSRRAPWGWHRTTPRVVPATAS